MRGITRRWLNLTGDEEARAPSLWRRLSAPQLFVGSFLLLVLLGTLGLRLLPGLYTGERLGWIDSLFTAVTAVCVTGLTIVDTATYFTTVGQLYLLLLIQLGGLGMIAFTTLIILALGRRLSLRQERLAAYEVAPHIRLDVLARDVVRFTFGFEAIGALILYAFFVPTLGWSGAAWPAVFHSVSAFCNAGFTTFEGSLIPFQQSPVVLLVVSALVILGGLGFLTIEESYQWWCARRAGKPFRISTHSRLVLITSGILLALGWSAFVTLEWAGVFREMSIADRLANGFVMSTMPRSGGFNSVDYARVSDSSNFLTILLMVVGGAPGSTAGGIKVTTLALLALLAWARIRGSEVVHVQGRSIPEETVQRAVGLGATVFMAVTISIFIFSLTEYYRWESGGNAFLRHMFEAVSAFNTVGLSMGATPELSPFGRVVSVVLMFVGRVGPLTFAAALALAARRSRVQYRYAYDDVVVG